MNPTGEEALFALQGHRARISAVAFPPNGHHRLQLSPLRRAVQWKSAF